MIVDTHTRIWHSTDQLGPQIAADIQKRYTDPTDRLDASEQAHNEATADVDVTFVLGARSVRLGADVPTELISQFVSRQPDRLIGFAGIDPMEDGFLEAVDRLPSQKMSGVVISPADQGFHPSHSRAMQLYDRCQALRMPLIVDQGNPLVRDSMLEYAQPALLDDVAREFPGLVILISHAGHPFFEQTLAVVGKHPNVFTDVSGLTARPWQLYHALLLAHQTEVTERLLFGSNFPYQNPKQAAETLFTINQFGQGTAWPTVPRQKLQAIVERDAMSCLGLKRGAATQAPATRATTAMPTPAVTEPTSESKA